MAGFEVSINGRFWVSTEGRSPPMKCTRVRAVDMVRRIRDRQAKALAGKSATEVIAFYRAAGEAATQDAAASVARRRTPANEALQPTSRAPRRAKTQRSSRAARG
jgi:hypothetical protein